MSANLDRLPDIEELFLVSPSQPRVALEAALVGNNNAKSDSVDFKRNNEQSVGSEASDSGDETSFAPAKVPGTELVWIRTFGCSHNISDSEYMAGLLSQYGYTLLDDNERDLADLWLVNTCTVKAPSQSAMDNVISSGLRQGKKMVVAGCVPQGDKKAKSLEGLSVIGVSQIDRIVEAVSETLKGNRVHMLKKKSLPRLDLPKIRKNRHIEIIPLSTGCLGACTYCKTVHARGQLGSYDPAALVQRAQHAVDDPEVREIWLSSEDTGAYGRDIGTNLPSLLRSIIAVLPADCSTMLRIGMTNPPFILEHLDAIAECLNDPRVFSYLHIPLQSGSNSVLKRMNREYTVEEFRRTADTLLNLVTHMELATDIIVGFPGETDEEWQETVDIVRHYQFPHCHISQMYVRPGTPAAKMKRVASQTVKARSRELTKIVDSFTTCYDFLIGTRQHVTIVDSAADGHHLVGHTGTYCQVLIPPKVGLLGSTAEVAITKSSRWSVHGELCTTIYAAPQLQRPAARANRTGEKFFTPAVEDDIDSAHLGNCSTTSSSNEDTAGSDALSDRSADISPNCTNTNCSSDTCCQTDTLQQTRPVLRPDQVLQENHRPLGSAAVLPVAPGLDATRDNVEVIVASVPMAVGKTLAAGSVISPVDWLLCIGAVLGLTGVIISLVSMLRGGSYLM